MPHNSQDTHDSTIQQSGRGDTGTLYVPASAQREQGIGIGDTVEVTLRNLDGIMNSVSFENKQVAGDCISVPAELMRRMDFEHGQEVTAQFERVDDVSELGQDRGSVDDLSDEDKKSLEEMFADEEDIEEFSEQIS